jgi:hypothetical protein
MLSQSERVGVMATATRWVGPFCLRDYLENCMDPKQKWPPEKKGVHVISLRGWRGTPKKQAGILYVGGNTSNSALFLTRVGSLIADMLGFWWHHSGGQSLWKHCRDHGLHPLDLYLGWAENVSCPRCAEREVYDALDPELGKKVPAQCRVDHSSPVPSLFG